MGAGTIKLELELVIILGAGAETIEGGAGGLC
jgi:hypothetical protein